MKTAKTETPAKVNPFYLDFLNEVYRSYDFFNNHFAEGKLPDIILSVTETGKSRNVMGWFGGNNYKIKDVDVHEIRISPITLERGGTEAFLETLLHEMAHLYNRCNNIKDVAGFQRHNKLFKTAALMFGLTCEKMGSRGFAKTDLGEGAKEAIELLNPKREVYTMYINNKPGKEKGPGSKLSPVMIDNDMKAIIVAMAGAAGVSQKDFVTSAINFYGAFLGKHITVTAVDDIGRELLQPIEEDSNMEIVSKAANTKEEMIEGIMEAADKQGILNNEGFKPPYHGELTTGPLTVRALDGSYDYSVKQGRGKDWHIYNNKTGRKLSDKLTKGVNRFPSQEDADSMLRDITAPKI